MTATDVAGIHAHDTKKLGRRPPKRAATLDVADFLTLPDHPIADAAPPFDWPMDRNDQAGDCVVAGLDHTLQAIAGLLGVARSNWTDSEILALYQTQNPGFGSWDDAGGPNDGGMDIQTFLEYLVHQGEILAFGKVDHTDEQAMKAAVWVGLALVTGEVLDVAQQDQKTWDYDPTSSVWGGHCTTSVAYDDGHQGVVTWGQLVDVTDAFVSNQVEEAWFILTTAHVNHPGFRDHFDLAGFATAVAELTNGKVVVPVDPPAPTPGPTPGPTPDPLADFPFSALDHWAARPHVFRSATVARRQYLAWKTRHGL